MFCYAMLCFALLMLCFATICYALPCFALRFALLCYAMLCFALLWVAGGTARRNLGEPPGGITGVWGNRPGWFPLPGNRPEESRGSGGAVRAGLHCPGVWGNRPGWFTLTGPLSTQSENPSWQSLLREKCTVTMRRRTSKRGEPNFCVRLGKLCVVAATAATTAAASPAARCRVSATLAARLPALISRVRRHQQPRLVQLGPSAAAVRSRQGHDGALSYIMRLAQSAAAVRSREEGDGALTHSLITLSSESDQDLSSPHHGSSLAYLTASLRVSLSLSLSLLSLSPSLSSSSFCSSVSYRGTRCPTISISSFRPTSCLFSPSFVATSGSHGRL